MFTSNTQGNDYDCENEICMGAWLDECMRNGSKRLSKSIHSTASGFITYNLSQTPGRHTVMHSYATRVEIGNISI